MVKINKIESLIEKLYSQECYRKIIFSFELFEPHTKPKGLKQKHFRYLFGDRKNLGSVTNQELDTFFKKFGEIDYKETMTQQDINHYLKYLHENKIINRLTLNKPHLYALSMRYYKNSSLIKINEYLRKWDYNEKITYFPSTKELNESVRIDWTLFGTMPQDKRISECIKVISKNFKKITEIKKENEGKTSFDFFLHAEA